MGRGEQRQEESKGNRADCECGARAHTIARTLARAAIDVPQGLDGSPTFGFGGSQPTIFLTSTIPFLFSPHCKVTVDQGEPKITSAQKVDNNTYACSLPRLCSGQQYHERCAALAEKGVGTCYKRKLRGTQVLHPTIHCVPLLMWTYTCLSSRAWIHDADPELEEEISHRRWLGWQWMCWHRTRPLNPHEAHKLLCSGEPAICWGLELCSDKVGASGRASRLSLFATALPPLAPRAFASWRAVESGTCDIRLGNDAFSFGTKMFRYTVIDLMSAYLLGARARPHTAPLSTMRARSLLAIRTATGGVSKWGLWRRWQTRRLPHRLLTLPHSARVAGREKGMGRERDEEACRATNSVFRQALHRLLPALPLVSPIPLKLHPGAVGGPRRVARGRRTRHAVLLHALACQQAQSRGGGLRSLAPALLPFPPPPTHSLLASPLLSSLCCALCWGKQHSLFPSLWKVPIPPRSHLRLRPCTPNSPALVLAYSCQRCSTTR